MARVGLGVYWGMGVAISALLAVPAFAQENLLAKPAKKYPWDQRLPRCFEGTPEHVRMMMSVADFCQYRGWVDYAETKSRVDMLMLREDFDLVERAENELGYSSERFNSGQYFFDAWYLSLDSMSKFGDHGAARASNWAKAKGSDGYARLAEALARYGEAWQARGGGYSNTVTPEGWELYRRKLDEADVALEAASPKVKQMGPWHAMKLRLAFENPKLRPSRLELLRAASKAWPDYMAIYLVPMNYAHPRWGGSFEQMDAVARFAAVHVDERGVGPAIHRRVDACEQRLAVRRDRVGDVVDGDLHRRGD